MTDVLLECGRGSGRRETAARDEGPTGAVLPGLVAAAKKQQRARHDAYRLSVAVETGQADMFGPGRRRGDQQTAPVE
jgi:hypothetical protein